MHIHTYTHMQIHTYTLTHVHARTCTHACTSTYINATHTHHAGSLHLSLARIPAYYFCMHSSSLLCDWSKSSSSPTGSTLFSRWPSCPLQQPSIPGLSGPHTQRIMSLTLFFTGSATTGGEGEWARTWLTTVMFLMM